MKKLLISAVITTLTQLNGAAGEQFKPLHLVPASSQLKHFDILTRAELDAYERTNLKKNPVYAGQLKTHNPKYYAYLTGQAD